MVRLFITSLIVLGGGLFFGAVPVFAAQSVSCNGTAVDEAALAADDVTFTDGGTGVCTFDQALSAASVVVDVGVTLESSAADPDGVNITTTGNFTLNGTITQDGKGCSGGGNEADGTGPNTATDGSCGANSGKGKAGYWGGGGGAHYGTGGGGGGAGQNPMNNGQTTTYDSTTTPAYMGSGGGGSANNTGGTGGGLVILDVAGTLDIEGTITAKGAAGGSGGSVGAGGGSGGSIYIKAGTISGSGSLNANGGAGGDSGSGEGGGGGGGIIALFYDTNSGADPFTVTNMSALGGTTGSDFSGSVNGGIGYGWGRDSKTDDGAGTITVGDNSGFAFDSGGDYARDSLVFGAGSQLGCAAQATLTISATGNITDNGSTFNCSNAISTKVVISAAGTLSMTGVDWDITNSPEVDFTAATWTTSGTNAISITKANAAIPFSITNDLTWNGMTFTCGAAGSGGDGNGIAVSGISWTLQSSSTLSCNTTATSMVNITVDSTSVMSADGMGCVGGTNADNGYGPDTGNSDVCTQTTAGAGTGGTYTASGGAHGGYGGAGGGAESVARNNNTYGNASAPTLLGSGAGAGQSAAGGAGGGIMRIDMTGTLLLDGRISANGADGSVGGSQAGGGGSGGSVYITGNTLDCTGSGSCSSSPKIEALGGNGANAANGEGGGGGGGRYFVKYSTDADGVLSAMTAANSVTGGTATTGEHSPSAEAGANGSFTITTNTVPSTPSVDSPSDTATNTSRGISLSGNAFSGDLIHVSTDWEVYVDNGGSPGTLAWSQTDDTSGPEDTVVNTSNGTFANTLSGKTQLAPSTKYHVRVRYTNGAGDSSWSSYITFTTTANVVPSTPSISAPTNGATGQSINPTITTSAYSNSDNDAHASTSYALHESSDCSGTAQWSVTDDTSNLTSIVVNTTNGTFADGHTGQTDLKGAVTYSVLALHKDSYGGESSVSTCSSFTTANADPTLASSISNQTLTEDTTSTGAFDLDTFFADTDWNHDDAFTCTATNGFSLGTMTIQSDRTVDFTPTANYIGSDTVQFSCEDAAGGAAASNSVTVSITNVNDTPTLATTVPNQTTLEDNDLIGVIDLDDYFADVDQGSGNNTGSGDTCTYSVVDALSMGNITINGTGLIDFTLNDNANGVDTVAFRCTDSGSATVDTNSITVTVTAVNDVPEISGAVDANVDEGDTLVIPITGTDIDSGATISLAAVDEAGDYENNGLTVTQLFTDNGDGTGQFRWSPDYEDAGQYRTTFKADDGTDSTTKTITVTVNDVNAAPEFSGALPNISFAAGQSTEAFDLDDYFSDVDAGTLTYTASGNTNISVDVVDGVVTFSASASFAGSETISFTATDEGGETANSNAIVVSVSASATLEDIDRLEGSNKGEGVITVIDKDGNTVAQWTAFKKGGVVPRVVEINGVGYVFAVKRRSGSTIHVYELTGGDALKKQRLSPKLHWRRLAVGDLMGKKTSEEIVVATRRDNKVYFKIFSYSPKKNQLSLLYKAKAENVRITNNNFSVSVQKKAIVLRNKKGKVVGSWTPFAATLLP